MSPERKAELEARLRTLHRRRDLIKEAGKALSRQINIIQTQLRAEDGPRPKLIPYAGAPKCKSATTTKRPSTNPSET
jgi:hypothetical protein